MKWYHKSILFCYNCVHPRKTYGVNNLPEGGAVLVCNHFSAFDCATVFNVCKKGLYFLAKKELCKNKLFTGFVTKAGAIPIDRDNPDVKTMLRAIKILKEGNKLAIYPEGTRNKDPKNVELQPLKGGSVLFAVKAKVPIVPIVLLRKGRMFRKTYALIAEPFELSEYYDARITANEIAEMDNVVRTKMLEAIGTLKQKVKNKEKC